MAGARIDLAVESRFGRPPSLMEEHMPTGPQGQKRPADVIGAAVMVARIATGEQADNIKGGRVRSGKAGGAARAAALTPEQRSEIARKAAEGRWG